MKRIMLIGMLICLYLNITQIATAGEGHDAGRKWAEQHGINDPDDCRSQYLGRWVNDNINNSPSFTEGCLDYLRDEGIIDDNDEIMHDDSEMYEDEQGEE